MSHLAVLCISLFNTLFFNTKSNLSLMIPRKVGILTAGGLAPCLSSAVGGLIERYREVAPEVEIICYRHGYQGLLLGDSFKVSAAFTESAALLHGFGGSPLGNSRVKFTNVKDCVKRGFVKEGEDPLAIAANQLLADGIDVLHTIGGDDTNTAAAELAKFLKKSGHALTVIGLPKTVDNDVFPIAQSLGAWTAAEEGARFFENVVGEHSANPRMLIVHEVMGRTCGWLTAATAHVYRKRLAKRTFCPELGFLAAAFDVHGVYIPELVFDITHEAKRLKHVMDNVGCVNIFVSEGAGVESIVASMEGRGETVLRDAFGHVKLDSVNVGQWFGKQFADMLEAEKVLVQKSGYFARSAPANALDLRLIKSCVDTAVECALKGESGVVGHDEDAGGRLHAIDFNRIKGGKPFNVNTPWFQELLVAIKQPSSL